MIAESAQVLVTVKAAPEPSAKYRDTVCIAGIRLDGVTQEWVRLYPVPFRHLADDHKFAKYDVVSVDLLAAKSDPRQESRRPISETFKKTAQHYDSKHRGPLVEQMFGPTMCDLIAGVAVDPASQSLGLVRVASVDALDFRAHPGWTTAQARSLGVQPDLFSVGPSAPDLEAPRFEVRYRWHCVHPGCGGHDQMLLDWEAGMLQRRYSRQPEGVVQEKVRQKFLHELCGPNRRPSFYVGNFADPVKRRHFAVLGIYSPKRTSDFTTLF